MTEPRLKGSGAPIQGAASMDAHTDPRRDHPAFHDRPVTENRSMTDAGIRQSSWADWQQVKLPTPPELEGFHLIYLSTTNSYDPISRRMMMGYTPVSPEEMPGWSIPPTIQNGEYAGMIGAQEMVLFKIPTSIYLEGLMHHHHSEPLHAEQKVRERVRAARLEEHRGSPSDPSGFDNFGRSPRPAFGRQLFDV